MDGVLETRKKVQLDWLTQGDCFISRSSDRAEIWKGKKQEACCRPHSNMSEVAADYLGNYSWLEQRLSVGEKQEMAGEAGRGQILEGVGC